MRLPRRLPNGFATGSVLLLALVIVLLAATLGALAWFQLLAAESANRSQDALLLAESAINEAVSKLSTPPFGAFGTHPSDAVTWQPDPNDGSRTGVVTFDTSSSSPYSTNNLNGSASVVFGWNGVSVPNQRCRLLGTGTSHGVVRHVEVVVEPYQFPYPLACKGPLVGDALHVTGAGTLSYFVASQGVPDPPSVGSVAYLGSGAVSVGQVHVNGRLYYLDAADGGPPCGPGLPAATVVREARAVSNLQLPVIDIPGVLTTAFASMQAVPPPATPYAGLPTVGPGDFTTASDPLPAAGLSLQNALLYVGPSPPCASTLPVPSAALTVSGDLQVTNSVLFVAGPLTVSGNLVLNHGIVYVTGGPVQVTGNLQGGGAVITDGAVSVTAIPQARYDTETAIVAGGSVTINPAAGPSSFYQGLLYSGTSITLNGVPGGNVMYVGGVVLSQGGVTLSNTFISSITECAALRYATWQPAAAPAFGTTRQLGTTAGFAALDATSAVSTTALSPCEVSSVYNAVNSMATAAPGLPYSVAYQNQVNAGHDSLSQATFGSYAMRLEAVFYDPNLARFVAPDRGGTMFQNGGNGIPPAAFDAVVPPGTTTEDLKVMLKTAEGLAVQVANQDLDLDETNALTMGFGGLPPALGAERVSLRLAHWLRINDMPSFTIVAWRPF